MADLTTKVGALELATPVIAASGTYGYGVEYLGLVDWSLLGTLLLGSLPGIWIGSRLVRITPDRLIRSLLSLLLAYAGVRLISL